MALEKETVHVAMNGAGVIGRRHFLQTIGLGAAGLAVSGAIPVSFTDWMALHAADLRKAADGLHPALDGRRPQPARDVRSQARHASTGARPRPSRRPSPASRSPRAGTRPPRS